MIVIYHVALQLLLNLLLVLHVQNASKIVRFKITPLVSILLDGAYSVGSEAEKVTVLRRRPNIVFVTFAVPIL